MDTSLGIKLITKKLALKRKFSKIKVQFNGEGRDVQCSSTLTALPEDLSLIPTKHMAVHAHVANMSFCSLWHPSIARVSRISCGSALQGYIKQPTIN